MAKQKKPAVRARAATLRPAEKAKPEGKARAAIRPEMNNEFRLGLLEMAAIAAFSLVVFYFSPLLAARLGPWNYAGAFLIALLSSATVFLPAGPLQLAIIGMARGLDPVLLGITAGVGSGIGEMTGYGLGRGSQHLMRAWERSGNRLARLQLGLLRHYRGPAIFVLAAVPNPFFDFAGIWAGLVGMRWWEFLVWCVGGRVVRFVVLAYFGIWSQSWLA